MAPRDVDDVDDTEVVGKGEPEPAAEESRILKVGAVLGGRYQVTRLIAAGAMSRVYLARQQIIHRPVAIKVIGREFARDRETMVRFQREVRSLAEVQHPGIVNVYDIGTTAMGEPYIVMEYVAGPSLAAEIKHRGRLPVAEAARILLQAAEALTMVHGVGVVHRDLKPSNLLLGRLPDRSLQLKIVDFGLAKATHEREGELLTKVGTVLGTPEYMAPEQIRSGDISGSADLYSLGCVAYEMLTGAPPFLGAEMSTLYRQLHDEPRRLTEACPTASIPPAIERLVLRLLAKSPGQRPLSAADLRGELIAACAEVGIDRGALGLTDSTPATGKELITPATTGSPAVAGPGRVRRLARTEVLLLAGLVAVASLAAGVGFERYRGRDRPPPAVPPTASPPAAIAPTPASTRLVVLGEPPDASMRLDDGERVPTPVVVEVTPGVHQLMIARAGFLAREQVVTVRSGATEVVRFELARATYDISIRTTPVGAAIAVDGAAAGASPATAKVTEGEFHEVTATLDGFQPVSHYLLAAEPQPEMHFRLRPALRHYGTLYIDTEGHGRVLIDGEETGLRAPTAEMQLSPGRHEVTLITGEGGRLSRTVTIRVNEPTVADFK